MRGVFVIAGVWVAALCAGCGQTIPLGSPSAVGVDRHSFSGVVTDGITAQAAALVVPLKGSLDGRYGTPSGQFPIIHETITVAGEASHLGHYAMDIVETVDLIHASAVGTFSIRAADGSTVSGDFTGQAQPGPLVAIQEQATIRGGTGRFSGATGQFEIDRQFDPVNRTTSGSFDGTVSVQR